MPNNPTDSRTELAQDLRTLADRIEDGEYDPTEVSVQMPSKKKDRPGGFSLEVRSADELERLQRVFDAASETIRHD